MAAPRQHVQRRCAPLLRIADGAVVEITTFGYSRFPAFGLPPAL
jgi:hypothetical protein